MKRRGSQSAGGKKRRWLTLSGRVKVRRLRKGTGDGEDDLVLPEITSLDNDRFSLPVEVRSGLTYLHHTSVFSFGDLSVTIMHCYFIRPTRVSFNLLFNVALVSCAMLCQSRSFAYGQLCLSNVAYHHIEGIRSFFCYKTRLLINYYSHFRIFCLLPHECMVGFAL